jgi:hypothetical protein
MHPNMFFMSDDDGVAQVVALTTVDGETWAQIAWLDGAYTFARLVDLYGDHTFFLSREACEAYHKQETANADQ